MRKLIIPLLLGVCFYTDLNAQSLIFPNAIRYPLTTEMPNSVVYPEEKKSLNGYIRGSAWGGGDKFDYANLFSEASIKGEYVKGFTEGYGFFKGEVRVRNGEFYDENKTELEIREMYVGYKNNTVEVTLGNQNVQWGRGIGSNPTNNISPKNGFILTSNGDDQKMYNLMLRTKVNITPNLEWEVIGIPIYKMNASRVDLLNIPVGAGTDVLPDKSFKNGSFATKLNLNGGPNGASISYFNGYDVTPGVNTGLDASLQPVAFAQPFKKQAFGGDFMFRLAGKSNGKSSDATNDLLVSGEVAYSKISNPDNDAYIPQSNLEFSLGLIKQFWDDKKLDNFTMILGYSAKYTPDFIEAVAPTDVTSPTYGLDMANFIQRGIAQGMFGQYKNYVQSLVGIFSKTMMNNKLNFTLVSSYGLTAQDYKTNGSSHSYLLYPKISWNITKELSASGGAFYLRGAGTEVVAPTFNGAFCDLKYNIKLK